MMNKWINEEVIGWIKQYKENVYELRDVVGEPTLVVAPDLKVTKMVSLFTTKGLLESGHKPSSLAP